jgi:OOP family OmpA-OmpF porin
VVGALHLRRGDLTIELAGTSAIIEGSVLSELTKSRILGAAEVLLPGFEIVDRITVKEPEGDLETLQHRLDSMLAADVVEFESDSARLTPTGIAVLDEVAKLLKEYPGRVQISGHTDSQASPDYNLDLSRRRSESVRDYLVSAGFDPGRLVTVGCGESRPVASNDTAEGRQRNRRTEFHVLEEN